MAYWEELKEKVAARSEEVLGKKVEVVDSPRFGDLSIPVFRVAKETGRNPPQVAEDLAGSLDLEEVERVEVSGGYVNIFLDRKVVAEGVLGEEEPWKSEEGKGKTVVIDYSSPNVAKPLHVGHLRSTIIGESLKRMYADLGYRVVGINYLGDVGTQFGSLIYAYLHWGDPAKFKEDPIRTALELYVRFHREAEENQELHEEAKRIYAEVERKKKEYWELWKMFRDLSIEYFQKNIYSLLEVSFDEYSGESFYIEKAKEIVEELKKKGVAVEVREGAKKGTVVADLEQYGLDHPVLLKSDGATDYLTRDLAAAVDRWEKYRFHRLLYVVGSAQSLHFRQMFKILELAGYPWWDRLVHVAFGMVFLPEGKISTRKGRVVFLEDVLREGIKRAEEELKKRGREGKDVARAVGVGAVIYAMIKVEPIKDVKFSWERALAFEGETGPYCQYSAVRARKILERVKRIEGNVEEVNDEEWRLLKLVAAYPSVMRQAAYSYRPNVVANHAYEMAAAFNDFYEKHRVAGSEREGFRALLVKRFLETQTAALHHLGIRVPPHM